MSALTLRFGTADFEQQFAKEFHASWEKLDQRWALLTGFLTLGPMLSVVNAVPHEMALLAFAWCQRLLLLPLSYVCRRCGWQYSVARPWAVTVMRTCRAATSILFWRQAHSASCGLLQMAVWDLTLGMGVSSAASATLFAHHFLTSLACTAISVAAAVSSSGVCAALQAALATAATAAGDGNIHGTAAAFYPASSPCPPCEEAAGNLRRCSALISAYPARWVVESDLAPSDHCRAVLALGTVALGLLLPSMWCYTLESWARRQFLAARKLTPRGLPVEPMHLGLMAYVAALMVWVNAAALF